MAVAFRGVVARIVIALVLATLLPLPAPAADLGMTPDVLAAPVDHGPVSPSAGFDRLRRAAARPLAERLLAQTPPQTGATPRSGGGWASLSTAKKTWIIVGIVAGAAVIVAVVSNRGGGGGGGGY